MNAILRKTEAGQQALQAREGGIKLPVRLRTLLLQIDGQKSSDQLMQLALSLGNQADALEKLVEMGLIESANGQPFEPISVSSSATDAITQSPEADDVEYDTQDLPASTKLPEHLRVVAAQMHELADEQLGLKAILLKRRISHCDTEQELRNALVALSEALGKASNSQRAAELLSHITAKLPIIGLNRPQPYKL